MREELHAVLKEFLKSRLRELKREKHLTQEEMADVLQMDRRTLAAVMSGEYSFGGLSTALFFSFLVKDPGREFEVLKEKFLEVLGEDWEERVIKNLR